MNPSHTISRITPSIRRLFDFVRVSRSGLFTAFALGIILIAAPRALAKGDVTISEQPVEVEVVNETPVPVESVDDALREPYFRRASVYVDEGSFSANVTVPIPAGKRLVVESVSFKATVTEGQGVIVDMRRHTDSITDGIPLSPQFAMPWHVSVGNFTYFTGNHALRLMVDAPVDSDGWLRFDMYKNSNAGELNSLTAAVTGYLVDL